MSKPDLSRATLAALVKLLRAADLPVRKRQELISSVQTVARAIGKPADTILADLRTLNAEIAKVSPAAVGISERRWQNCLSHLRAALKIAGRQIMPGRSATPVGPAWLPLYEALPTDKDRYSLSRPLRWLSGVGVGPREVQLRHLQAYSREATENALTMSAQAKWVDARRAWNRSVARVAGWPQLTIPTAMKADGYWLPWSDFPATLNEDVDAWRRRASIADFADEDGPDRALAPATIKSRVHLFQSLASALVQSGVSAKTLRSLAACLRIENYTLAMRFFHKRLGETESLYQKAYQLRSVARYWCKADAATLKQMAKIVSRFEVEKKGMTEKNRRRLMQLRDPATQAALLGLTDVLYAEITRGRISDYRAVVMAQMMVALEIVLTAPLRIKNLAAIEIDRHLEWAGDTLNLIIPADEVKNDVALHFEFTPERAALIRWHVDRLRRADPTCQWLFPGTLGRHKAERTLATQLEETIRRRVGVRMNVHLFRHFAAMLFLDAHPGEYETMRRVLGHKRLQTTINFYVGLETRSAARRFDSHIQELRSKPRGPKR